MRYYVRAYIEKSMRGLIDSLETNDWSEVEEFIWENCQHGLNCEFVDLEYDNNCGVAYADLFTPYTVEVEELIIRKGVSDVFYADLLMEQQEQM